MTILLLIILILFIIYSILGNRKLEIYIQQIIKDTVFNNKIKENIINKNNSSNLLDHANCKLKRSSKNNINHNKRSNSFHVKRCLQKKTTVNELKIRKIPFYDHNESDKNNHKQENNISNIFDINDDIKKDNSNLQMKIYKKSTKQLNINKEFDKNGVKRRILRRGRTVHIPMPPKKKIKISPDNRDNSTFMSIDKTGAPNIIISNNVFIKMNKSKKKKRKQKSVSLDINNYRLPFISKKIKNNRESKKSFFIDNRDKNIQANQKNFTNQELNTLDYKEAIIYDKRTYIQYYWSLLKKKQLILFIIISNDDYNLITIKIALFFLSFSLFISLNGFFFSDSTMHLLYENNGCYNIINQIPIICYSTLITTVINIIMRNLSLSENNMLEIKHENSAKRAEERAKVAWPCIKIKILIFFILSFLLMIFFWYFISRFCGVYKNTQIILIKDTILSFGLSMLYPFGLNLIPGIFRIPSLRASKKDKECLYKVSLAISLF